MSDKHSFLGGEGRVWPAISALKGKPRMAAVAFLGEAAPDLLPQFGKGDVIICDASEQSVANGLTSAGALQRFRERGVLLYSVSSLHAKIVIVGSTAAIGSMNASQTSAGKSEAAVLTSDPKLVSAATGLIRDLIPKSIEVDEVFVNRARRIRTRRANRIGTKRPSEASLVTFSAAVKQQPPAFLRKSIEAFETPILLRAGFKMNQSWSDPNDRREHRVGDLVVWLYEEEEGPSAVDIGRIVAIEKVRTRWLYHEVTPAQPPRIKKQQIRTCLFGLGYPGSLESLGDSLRRVRLSGLEESLQDLFGPSFPPAN